MKPRILHVALSTGFAAALCSVGLVQTVTEAGRGEWPQAFDLFRRVPTAANLRTYEQELADACPVGRRVRPWMQYVQFMGLRDGGEKALVGRDGWLFYRPGVEALARRPRPAGATGDPLPAIVDFRDRLLARGIRLLVVPVPNKESVYPEMLSARAVDSPGDVNPETRNLMARLAAHGIETVDLFEAFTASRTDATRSPLYLKRDSHWSPAGVEVAARAVARRLVDAGWVAEGVPAYERRPAPVRRVGDLVQMLQSLPLERSLGAESAACVRVVRKDDGTPYRDDPAAPVLVLGDSFLRIYERDEPGAAGFVAHLAAELEQPVASLVTDGGAATLVRQDLCRRPGLLAGKRVVIWEFTERDLRLDPDQWPVVPLPPES